MFVPDVEGFSRAFKSKDGMLGRWMDNLAGDVRAAVAFEAPGPGKPPHNRTGFNYGKGRLMGTVGYSVSGTGVDEVEGHVYVKPPYARFVIHGTKPHVIKPRKTGGMLKFYWFKKARWMVLPQVKHPGQAANDFMIRGLRRGLAANGIL